MPEIFIKPRTGFEHEIKGADMEGRPRGKKKDDRRFRQDTVPGTGGWEVGLEWRHREKVCRIKEADDREENGDVHYTVPGNLPRAFLAGEGGGNRWGYWMSKCQ